MKYFELLCEEFMKLEEVESLALGGSRVSKEYDEKSDYDLYVYCNKIPDDSVRKVILEKTCQYIEMGNQFWEFEDDCTLKDGVDIDILYRNIDDFEAGLKSVVLDHVAWNGYTTCMWHNLLNSKIIYDRDGRFENLQNKYNLSYPTELKCNIICKNMKLLSGMLPSYDGQILKALNRGDIVSVNHRTAAFLESYFDIIFALNEMTHPGEKRMIEKALAGATILPEHFEENINLLLHDLYGNPQNVKNDLRVIIEEISKLTCDYQ